MRPAIPTRLGATPTAEGTSFALWSDSATAVEVCLLDATGAETRFTLPHREGPVWHGFLAGVGPGQRYGFRVHGEWSPQTGHTFNSNKLLIDPYAHHVVGDLTYTPEIYAHQANDVSLRDERDSLPYVPLSVITAHEPRRVTRPHHAWTQTVIYEAHVRGLTAHNLAIPEEMRGSYAALGHESVIEHLTKLGVTALELLPIHHFLTEPAVAARGRRNLWGYNSIAFSAPHSAYASTDDPVTELQQAVDRLHEAGIEVILDVVYNHTAEGGNAGPMLSMKGIDNRAYYRLTSDGRYIDYTGCGNTINSASPYVTRFIADSLRWWAEVVGVDGFRFDLLSAIARDDDGFDPRSRVLTAISQDPLLRELKLISEPWDATADGYGVGTYPEPWREWNDKFRDGVRSFWLSKGYVGVRDIAYRVSGSSDVYPRRDPTASINFVTAHDGFTMQDLVTWNHKHNEPNGERNADGTDNNRSWNCGVEGPTKDVHVLELRRKLHRSLMATLLLSAGIPMITMGDEVGRTQHGSNNAYTLPSDENVDDALAWKGGWALPWTLETWQHELFETTSALTQLRRLHPLLSQNEFFTGRTNPVTQRKDLAWFGADGEEVSEAAWHDSRVHTLGYHIESAGSDADSLLVLLHAGPSDARVTLPSQPWARELRLVLDTRTGQPVAGEVRAKAGSVVTIASHSVQVWLVES